MHKLAIIARIPRRRLHRRLHADARPPRRPRPIERPRRPRRRAARRDHRRRATQRRDVQRRSPARSGAAPAPTRCRIPNNILSKRSVYFDYDSFVVTDEYKPHRRGARQVPAGQPQRAQITLQGHTDERGSREYNIALGQKRADAVKRMMMLLGVQEIQIETVSFGKEKPQQHGPRRSGVGREPPRRHRLRRRVSDVTLRAASACAGASRSLRLRARARTPRCSTTTRRASASRPRKRASTQVQKQLDDAPRRARAAVEEPGPRRSLAATSSGIKSRLAKHARADRGADLRARAGAEAPARSLRRSRFAAAQAEAAALPRRRRPPLPPTPTRRRRAADVAGTPPPSASPPPHAGACRVAAARRRRSEQRAYDAALDQFKRGDYPRRDRGVPAFREDVSAQPARAVGAILDRQRAVRAQGLPRGDRVAAAR